MSKTSPATFAVLLVTFVGSILLGTAGADGNVGCIYEDVCIKNIEWCFDDGAFGRCLPSTPGEDDLYRYNLNYSDLEKFKTILQDIQANNFGWKNSYAQCLIQAQLYAIKLGTEFSGQICSHLMLQHYEDPIRKLKEFEKLHPEGPVGVRRSNYLLHSRDDRPEYNTNNNWPNYKSPEDRLYSTFEKARNELDNDLAGQLIALPLSNKNNPSSRKRKKSHENNTHARFRGTPLYMPKHRLMTDKTEFKKMERENEQLPILDKTIKNSYYQLDGADLEPANYDEDSIEDYKLNGLIDKMNQLSKSTTYTEGGPIYLDKNKNFDNNLYNRLLDDYESDIWGFRRSERLDVKKPGPYFKVNNYAFQNMNKQFKPDGSSADLTNIAYQLKPDTKEPNFVEQFLPKPLLENFQNPEYTYVPGTSEKITGNIFPEFSYVYVRLKQPIPEKSAADVVDIISSNLNVPKYIFADVKLSGNKLLFKIVPNTLGITALSVQKGIDEVKEMITIPVLFTDVGNQSVFSAYKDLDNVDYDDSRDKKEDNVDSVIDANRLIYMDVNNTLLNWQSAERILTRIETLMGIKRDTFKLLNVVDGTITFEIISGHGQKKLNNVKVSADIEAIRNDLRAENITIISVEPISEDDYTDGPLSIPLQNPKGFLYVLTISMCILLGAIFVLAVAFGFVRKHARAADKLKKINNPSSSDVEHSKDYQLCRARMAEKPPEISSHVGHRITSISRESDNSPSSRSSTSSWSEEPIYNIDISTGHAFMAYMESHLQNEGRLDAEWVALCAYEAEPSETSVAHQPENRNKNRYINAVPYDHARIRLNALSNVSGSDYINASPIYDTDPRAPAYITTQGPLPETTIDFWQMVWEQGSVIIVMLTRLVENDVTMCHRYWPRETTEIYGIYDIHLVSEHMWDDDHLVRSFYLRNIKTTETRTVTQFHFLLWPEGGIPAINRTLLDFRRKVNKSFRGRSCPIIVHCSDGCGRSGTYILLDMVLNRICKGAKEIDIAATLEHIRDQRSGTVSTKAQFEFVLEAVAEEVNTILQSIPQPQLSHDLQRFEEIPRPSQQPVADNSVAASSSTTSQCTVIEEEPTTTSSNGSHEQAKTEDDTSKQIKGEKK